MANYGNDHTPVWDDVIAEPVPKNTKPMEELGVSGLKRAAGMVDEEFLPALRGRKSVHVYREMSNNDSMVGALLFAITQLIKNIDFRVTPADQTPEARKAAEFLESCKDDMSHSWGDFITEVLSMLPYGWAWHEIVYKRRIGPWEKDAKKRSKYDDGLIGWRKMPIRSQETMIRWVFDETGGIQGMTQLAPPAYKLTTIPISKSLLFRTNVAKGNPEGVSILRSSYRSWYLKKRLEEFEAIGVERDLAGMPVVKLPADYLNPGASVEKKEMVKNFRKMVRGVRRDENEGLILPQQWDENSNPLFEFELMSAGGSRQFDTNAIISRYEQRILMSVLADFILVGHEGQGSYSLHTDKTGIFRSAINSIADSIADVLNRHAVPRLFEANAWKLKELPRFEPANVDPPNLGELSQFISATSGAGMQWFPNPELEKFMRDIGGLPDMTDDELKFKQDLYMADQAMQGAESQMGILGMRQKAEMTAQGFSPEQAQMASEQPNSELMAEQQAAELDAEEAMQGHPAQQRRMEQEAAMQQGPGTDPAQADEALRQKAGEAEIDDKRSDNDHKRSVEMEKLKARMQANAAKKSKPPAKKGPKK